MEALSLIDVSAEDDFLFDLASPPQHPDPPPRAAPGPGTSAVGADLGQPVGASQAAAAAAVKALDPTGATEQVPERTESPKKSKPKGGVNLRKSLAWDSAFFTGEGVLDTEELGIVNSTFRKAQGSRLLPGIVEEMRRSSESTTSTLESESFLLESLDSELFDNVRASVQRTLGKPDKAPGVPAASSRNPKAAAKAPPVTTRNGVDRIPQTQSKIRPPGSTNNGCVGTKQRPQVTLKEPTVTRGGVPRAAEAKPSSRPPRALPRVATMGAPANTAATSGVSDKRSSTGGVVNRQAVGKSVNTSVGVPSRPGGGTKTSSTTKSGALSSTASPSLHSTPVGTMPGAKTKPPTLIGKTRTAKRIPIRSSSRSDVSNVEPARGSRNKIPTRSNIEGPSPTISPSSSVDSMSSVISGVSTASTIGRVSQTSESFSTRSSSLSPSTRKSNDHPPTTKPRPLTVTEGTPCDNRKSNIETSTQGNGFKPSGLRRPTPKIGYFDAEKSVEQKAARVHLQSTKGLFSPLATPNPRISSTPKATFEFSTIDQQELKSMAAAFSQTKASPSLPLRVTQIEVKPSKEVEHGASQIKGLTSLPLTVAETDVESSKVTEHEAYHTEPSPSLPLSVAQTEASKVTEHIASTEALPLLPVRVAETEVDPSKVSEHEEHMLETGTLMAGDIAVLETGTLMAGDIAEDSMPQARQTDVESSKVTEHEAYHTDPLPSLPLRVAQTEASKVTDHAASQTEALPLLPLRIAETQVSEHEEHLLETGTLMAGDIAEDSMPQACPPSWPLGVSEMDVEPSELIDRPVFAAADTAKENIPALHQNIQLNGAPSPLKKNSLASHDNIQAEVDMTPAKGTILASHPNVQAIGEMTPVTLLTQKLSSISLGAANGEATPLTLLAQKLSSISLGDGTD